MSVQCKPAATYGLCPPGWKPEAWVDNLRRMANRCDERHQDEARLYRASALELEQAIEPPTEPDWAMVNAAFVHAYEHVGEAELL